MTKGFEDCIEPPNHILGQIITDPCEAVYVFVVGGRETCPLTSTA